MAKATLIIIRIGIVEFVPKESHDYSIVDDFPDLNIYEKIQILLYENQFINKENYASYSHIDKSDNVTNIKNKLDNVSNNNNNKLDNVSNIKNTKPIPIPKKLK